jgi:transposase
MIASQDGTRTGDWHYQGMVSTIATLFHVASSLGGKVIATMLDATFTGIVTSDRLKTYRALPVDRRQVCWAHLTRTLVAFYERDGPLAIWAADVLAQIDIMFALWSAFRNRRLDRETLVAGMQPIQTTMRVLLEVPAQV